MGPFYCPLDRKVYIDLSFYNDLKNQHGTSDKVSANQLSIRQELKADCFAGLWTHHANRTRHLLEEALTAAAAIGDDRLQKQTRGHVTPDSFTHGSSEQRVKWFTQGLDAGSIEACNTFSRR